MSLKEIIKDLKVGSLCCGIGAFDISLENHGAKVVWANDIEKKVGLIYPKNFPNTKFILEDINKIDFTQLEKVDILCGGFPCQPFSVGGKKLGFNDDRGQIFFQFVRAIEELGKPRILLFENVKHLVKHDNGNTFKVISDELTKLGYIIKHRVINARLYTRVPQNRERIYLVCFKNQEDADKFTLFDGENLEKHKRQSEPLVDYIDYSNKNNIDYSKYIIDPTKYKPTSHKSKVAREVVDTDCLYVIGISGIRKLKGDYCCTLCKGHDITMPVIKMHDGKHRRLTERELLNLVGFPQNFNIDGISRNNIAERVGNSIVVPVIDLILEKD